MELPNNLISTKPAAAASERTGKNIPQPGNEKGKKCGRPVNMAQEFAFQEIAKFLNANIDYIPDSLKTFLREIFSEKKADVKLPIGQAIIQAARPKVLIPPLQIGLAVQMKEE
ncbi:hypothetical protein DPMN_008612, partial [Dreissena polymorpha]